MSSLNKYSLRMKTGALLVLVLFILSLLSWLAPASEMDLARSYELPSLEHPFGLDENGRDVFWQILQGSRVSFLVAFSVVLVSLFIGLVIGSLSGYFKMLDPILMRIVDMFYAFPNFLLAMALMAVLGSSVFNLILVMSLSTWASYARLVRGEVLHLKEREFVLSVDSLGAGFVRKMAGHIWPNLIPVLTVQTTLTLAGVILSESGLSFLGIGIPPEVPTWGTLLRAGRLALMEAPHLSFFPGVFLFLLILGFHLLGEGFREFLSPYKRQTE
ncbi:MAG: ABC transporter permease [Bdellovibrionales bacterium]|nr:ABC transporter permease [Bdellovibrionales bacterium]